MCHRRKLDWKIKFSEIGGISTRLWTYETPIYKEYWYDCFGSKQNKKSRSCNSNSNYFQRKKEDPEATPMISDQDKISVPPKLPPIADSVIGKNYYWSTLKKKY